MNPVGEGTPSTALLEIVRAKHAAEKRVHDAEYSILSGESQQLAKAVLKKVYGKRYSVSKEEGLLSFLEIDGKLFPVVNLKDTKDEYPNRQAVILPDGHAHECRLTLGLRPGDPPEPVVIGEISIASHSIEDIRGTTAPLSHSQNSNLKPGDFIELKPFFRSTSPAQMELESVPGVGKDIQIHHINKDYDAFTSSFNNWPALQKQLENTFT